MDASDGQIGHLLSGTWRLERVIGRGASSKVYAAVHRETARQAAIKVLHPELASDRDVRALFLAEGYLVSEIHHPGVTRVLGDGVSEDGCPYLIFELLIGQTLDERRQACGGRIPLDEMLPIADAIMDTLAAVHDAGIIHRDLKPQNIVALDGGGIKLLDFGLAKAHGRTADAAQDVVGTPSFMPPEQALGLTKKMDAQSDVWALGATLFYLLSGQPVHVAKHTTAMLLASASTKPRSLADAAPELPRAIVDVVDRALSYRKAGRFRNIREMRAAWHDAYPTWLPTLRPPSYVPDPAFLDPSDLVDDSRHPGTTNDVPSSRPTPLAITLFDPRELALEVEGSDETMESAATASPLTAPAPRLEPTRWRGRLVLAATTLITLSVVLAMIALSADEGPSSKRSASPPASAMDLPNAATSSAADR